MTPRTVVCTCLALLGFAGNSLLCRLALRSGDIDAASFTSVRLLSGAFVLGLLAATRPSRLLRAGSRGSGLALFAYAAPFSFAYVVLPTGTGALILFGCVQTTMLGRAMARGERLHFRSWVGFLLAIIGLLALNAPGTSAPQPLAAASMALAGIAWGVYSLRGKASTDPPLLATAANFFRCLPLTLLLSATTLVTARAHVNASGLWFAFASGALASGVGYSLWYMALPQLKATQAAIIQLLVPVLAAVGGIVLLGEPLTRRLVGCGAAIVTGVLIALPGHTRR